MRYLQALVAMLKTMLESVTTWVQKGGKWVMETKVVQKAVPHVQSAAAWTGDLAGRAIAATPGAAWTATKLTAAGGWAATKFLGRTARDHGPGAIKATVRGTGKALRVTGKVAAAPVVLPVKGAAWSLEKAAGLVGRVGGALLSPIGAVFGGGGGSVPTPPPPPPAEPRKDDAERDSEDGLTEEERNRRDVALAVRRAVRARARGEDAGEFLDALRDQLDDEQVNALGVWVDQLRPGELKQVGILSLTKLGAHLESKRKLPGLPTVAEGVAAAEAAERSRPFAERMDKVRALRAARGNGAGMTQRRTTRDLLNDEYAAG